MSNHTKHDIKLFVYELKVLGKMTEISDDQVLESLKGAFPAKIGVQLFGREDGDIAISKARMFVLLFKSE